MSRRCWRLMLRLVCAVALPLAHAGAQGPPPPGDAPPDAGRAGALRVFVDCEVRGCDFDFFRDQLRWVHFVRDRLDSDVLLLVTALPTGAGGSEVTIAAIGGERFRSRTDTAVVIVNPNDATDVARRSLARTFSLMLASYAVRTPIASQLDLSYRPPPGQPGAAKPARDRWNYWVYRLSANGYGSGEQQQSYHALYLSTSANRVTAQWKVNLNASLGYNESRFSLSDGSTYTNLQRNYGGNALVVRGLSEHWSAGVVATGQYSDYNNYQRNLRISPALEWDLFPYRDFTRRQLTAYYSVGAASMRYKARTIYDQIEETRPFHALTLGWIAKQPWGSVNWSVFGSQYLHATRYYSYGSSASVDLRIARGLALNLGGYYSRVHDQLYLPRGELSDNEIIARQQALATSYRFYLNFGLSYTFGSIFNSVVNPRFNRAASDVD